MRHSFRVWLVFAAVSVGGSAHAKNVDKKAAAPAHEVNACGCFGRLFALRVFGNGNVTGKVRGDRLGHGGGGSGELPSHDREQASPQKNSGQDQDCQGDVSHDSPSINATTDRITWVFALVRAL